MIRKCILFVTACFLMVSTSSAQQLLGTGIPRDQFNFFAASQKGDELCWAASVQMILNFYGINVTQDDIVMRTFGKLTNHTGTDDDINRALDGLATGSAGQHLVIRSFIHARLPDPSILVEELLNKRPILLTFATGAYSGHAVVITGATYFPGPAIQSLIIRDPYPNPINQMNQGRVEISGAALANFSNLVRNHWLVSVQGLADQDLPLKQPAPSQRGNSVSSLSSATAKPDDASQVEQENQTDSASTKAAALLICESDHQDCVEAIPTHDSCMRKQVNGCMADCINNFGIPAEVCRAQKCDPTSSANSIFEDHCADSNDRKLAACTRKRKQCKLLVAER